jgi:hypothetical protein
MTHRFDIEDIEYMVTVSYFDPGRPGRLSGPPEDCYPDDPWEIEFEPNVEATSEVIEFETFVELYASHYYEGNERKALEAIEQATYEGILESADEYQP